MEETERIVSERVEARVAEVIASDTVQQSVQERLTRERTLLEEQVGRPEPLPDAGWCGTPPLHAGCWLEWCLELSPPSALQVEMELAQERAAAEAEAQRAKEAIQAKERELQQIEVERQQEV